MNIVLEMGNWIVDDEYFITNGFYGYEVYKCGTETEEAKELYSSRMCNRRRIREVFNLEGE